MVNRVDPEPVVIWKHSRSLHVDATRPRARPELDVQGGGGPDLDGVGKEQESRGDCCQ